MQLQAMGSGQMREIADVTGTWVKWVNCKIVPCPRSRRLGIGDDAAKVAYFCRSGGGERGAEGTKLGITRATGTEGRTDAVKGRTAAAAPLSLPSHPSSSLITM